MRRMYVAGSLVLAAAAVVVVALGFLGALGAGCGSAPGRAAGEELLREAVWRPGEGHAEAAYDAASRALDVTDPAIDELLVTTLAAYLSGHVRRGEELLERLRARAPRRAGTLLMEGYRASLRHDRPEARRAFGAAIAALEARPDEEPLADEIAFLARLYRGEEAYFQQEYDSAVADLTLARSRYAAHGGPPHRELLRVLADAHVQNQEYGPAEAVLREALTADPGVPQHHFQLGMVLAAQARSDEARAEYDAALAIAPEDPRPRLKLAEIARREGDLAAMGRQLDILAARPDAAAMGGELHAARGAYAFERGRGLMAQGRDDEADAAWREARQHLLAALGADPLCTRALTLLVQVASLLGDDAGAAEYKRRLDEVEHAKPTFPAAADPSRTFC